MLHTNGSPFFQIEMLSFYKEREVYFWSYILSRYRVQSITLGKTEMGKKKLGG